jgi:spermidine/putrescine transport system substrate-binding protein
MRTPPRRPLSPEAAAILSATGISRRSLMRGIVAGATLAAAGGVLAACGTKGTGKPGAAGQPACTATDVSATEKKLVFSNWPLYIDVDDKDANKRPSLDTFAKNSGLAVTYQEDINDNDEFFGKIRTQLAACQNIDRDIIVLTDWMAARLVNLGWVQAFDKAKLTNFPKNLAPGLQARAWDKDMVHAAPWQSGMTAFAYNGKVTSPIASIDDLLTRPDLKGKVSMLTEMNDTVGLLLLSMGKDPGNFTDADFDNALDKLKKAVDSGQIRKFTGNDYKEDLAKGDLAACMAWSGDVIQLSTENDKIKWVAPDSGVMLWSDNMLIPATSTHKANAELLIDYYYDPKVAAELAAWVNYICPVAGAQEEMAKLDADLASNPLIFPDAATQSKAHGFMALTEAQRSGYEKKFQQVIGA